MAGLACHMGFGPGALVLAQIGVEIFLELRGMALHTHEAGVVLPAAPVQLVAWCNALRTLQVEPALPALVCGTAVPCQVEGLQAAVGHGNQVLLQGRETQRVGDFKVCGLSVRTLGADEKFAIAFAEHGARPILAGALPAKRRKHRGAARGLHGQFVVGAFPGRGFLRMALRTDLGSDMVQRARVCGGVASYRLW